MTLAFRNVDVSPQDPVESWPDEAVRTALERGSLGQWRRLAAAIRSDPWGTTAQQVGRILTYSRPYGVADLMEEVMASARREAEGHERLEVAEEIRAVLSDSGLTRSQFAARIGTSSSRLSTYLSGKVVPSAALMVRMRGLRPAGGPVSGPRRSGAASP